MKYHIDLDIEVPVSVEAQLNNSLPQLPEKIVARDGQVIDVSGRMWVVFADGKGKRRAHTFNLDSFRTSSKRQVLTPADEHVVALYLADRLTRVSPSTVVFDQRTLLLFLQWLHCNKGFADGDVPYRWAKISESTARSFYRWELQNRQTFGRHLRSLRVFYNWGVVRGFEGFRSDVARQLSDIRGKRPPLGEHVRFRHTTKGPLSSEEIMVIRQGLRNEAVDDEIRVVIMLLLELGIRPLSIILLKNSDLRCYTAQTGESLFILRTARAKQHTSNIEYKSRPLSSKLGQLLSSLKIGEPDDPLIYWIPKRASTQAIQLLLKKFVELAELKSPRTGKQLELHARRFRTTLATDLMAQGAPKTHVAEILDHSSTNYVDVYAETSPSIGTAFGEATDHKLGPLVDRFLGTVVEPIDNGNVALIPSAIPHLAVTRFDLGGIGYCGRDSAKEAPCRLLPPLSCYTCAKFLALKTGPHRQVLTSIEDSLAAMSEISDPRITRQLDETRDAIREVITVIEMGSS